jgi:DeoR family L-fucose operon activator
MLVAERYEKIVQVVNDRGSIRVSDLSKLFDVTEETIRRDLDHLQSLGKLQRSHGGAVKTQESQSEIPYFEREDINVEEKKGIAREAVKHIQTNERIILDASTTAWYMAAILPNIPLTVLTNSIKVALELSSKDKIDVISTGGQLTSKSLSYIGPLAERSLESYYVDKAFISCKGVHLKRGISESNEFQGRLKQRMIGVADKVYLMADYSKFGLQAFTHVASCDKMDVVITDSKTEDAVIAEFTDLHVKVIRI